MKHGIFFGIGVGPGDPELLTVKASPAIQPAAGRIAPKTEKKDGSVALSIARPYLKPDVEIVYQVFPMVRDFAEDPSAWQENKREILELLREGKNVAFLTLGDPMFFSTYIYVYRLLQHEEVTIETIPGVPAFAAIASASGHPIVEGDDILTVIPATARPEKIQQAMQASDNVVLMKVYKNFPAIVEQLKENDMLRRAVLVSRAGLDGECVIADLAAQQGRKLNYLSTILTRREPANQDGAEARKECDKR